VKSLGKGEFMLEVERGGEIQFLTVTFD